MGWPLREEDDHMRGARSGSRDRGAVDGRSESDERIGRVEKHAIDQPVDMSIAQMKEAAGMGAFIEFVGGFIVGSHASHNAQQYVDAMRAIGVDHVILSSDSGQMGRPFPDDMIALVVGQLKAKGMMDAELRTIMVENPAALMGLGRWKGSVRLDSINFKFGCQTTENAPSDAKCSWIISQHL